MDEEKYLKNSRKQLIQPIKCFVCSNDEKSVSYNILNDLITHIRVIHRSLNLASHKCTLCCMSYQSLEVYRKHLVKHINKEQLLFYKNKRGPVFKCDRYDGNTSQQQQPEQQQYDNGNNIVQITNSILPDDDFAKENNEPDMMVVVEANNTTELKEFGICLENYCIEYILKLCAYTDLTRKRVFEIVADNTDLIKMISKQIHVLFRQTNYMLLNEFRSHLENMFKNIKTEHLFFKKIRLMNIYCPPVKYAIRKGVLKQRTKKGKTVLIKVNEDVSILNLKFVLKKIFEIPGLLDNMMKKQKLLLDSTDGRIDNFVQGKIFRDILQRNPSQIIVPYNMYNDDVEIASVTGHNTGKNMMSVFTIVFPLLEDFQLSKVEYMFPIAFARTKVTKENNKDRCLGPIIDDMDDVARNGLEITVNDKKVRVHFILGLFIGDNKALHEFMGHAENFNDEYICRDCLMTKDERRKAVEEDPSLLRNPDDYEQHVTEKLYGVRRNCLLNKIYEYHVSRNHYHDIFHDIFYRVLRDGLQDAIDDGVRSKKFDIPTLKNLFKTFDYGEIDSNSNRLDDTILDTSTGKLNLTGNECTNLIKYYSLVLGHLYDKKNKRDKEILDYVHLLEELVNLCLSETFTKAKLSKLKYIVKKHHTEFIRIFKFEKSRSKIAKILLDEFLKPKHHFATHYHGTIEFSGPLKSIWTMRLESHLRDVKRTLEGSTSRVNPAYTVCKKYAMKFALFLHSHRDGKFSYIKKGPQTDFTMHTKEYQHKLIVNADIDKLFNNEKIYEFNHVTYKGTYYRSDGTHHVLQYDRITENKLFYRIVDIISPENNDSQILFIVQRLRIDCFNVHYNCYVFDEYTDIFDVVSIDKCSMPFNVLTLNNRLKVFKINENLYN